MFVIYEDSFRVVYSNQPWDEALNFLERKAKREGFDVSNIGGVLDIVAPDESEQWLMYTNVKNATYDCFRHYNLLAEILNLPAFETKTVLK